MRKRGALLALVLLGVAVPVSEVVTGPDPGDVLPLVQLAPTASGVVEDGGEASGRSTPVPVPVDYFDDRVLVEVDASRLAIVSHRHDLSVRSPVGVAGIAALAVPPGRALPAVLAALRSDPDVASVFPAGRIQGACKDHSGPVDFQWHRKSSKLDKADYDTSGWVVAVVDSGVAYEDWADASGQYYAASSLAGVDIIAPIDLVNDDDHANDDHQHGTHIASLILSDGIVRGVSPGASLMPVKVLDESNQGDELALIEGIHHAVDHGADVINLSLSFGPGYQPSSPLLDALARAAAEGVVLVAAAGNAGLDAVSWPAAHPDVIAVGATSLRDKKGKPRVSPFSNLGAVDLLAPGGDIDVDENDDGYGDGLLAETFALGHPTELGLWFQSGTSQAAALVSGAALQLLAAGASPDEVRTALLQEAEDKDLEHKVYEDGVGAGVLNLDKSLKLVEDDHVEPAPSVHAAMLPYLVRKKGDEVEPHARFFVVDDRGQPMDHVTLTGRAWGTTSDRFACETDKEGICDAKLESVSLDDDGGSWAWELHTAVVDGIGVSPGALLVADPSLEVMTQALRAEPSLSKASVAVYWPEASDSELGDLAESYTVPNFGTGLLSSPMGLVFTPRAMRTGKMRTADLSMDGTGLLSSPMGLVRVRHLTFARGSGLLSSPLGIVAFDGVNLRNTPLAFSGRSWFEPMAGSGLLSSPLGLVPLRRTSLAWGFVGASVENQLAAGGWTFGADSVPSVLLASGMVPESDQSAELDGSGAGSERF